MINLKGRDVITTQEFSLAELLEILDLADEMKKERFNHRFSNCLNKKTFLMFFYNPSVRTRQSFECAATELGGHAQFLEPKSMRLKTAKTAGETIEDAAKVMSRYGCGIGIRILEDKVPYYGAGNELLREYAKYASVPIINMADDKFHPCQGLADMQEMRKIFNNEVKGRKLLMVWGHGALCRSWCSVQENLLISSRFGMDVVLAYPEGYDLDPEIIAQVKKNCEEAGSKFEITHEPVDCYDNVDIVYSRNWMSPQAYVNGVLEKQKEIEKALKYTDWICDEEKIKRTNNAYYIHPMPVDRGHEVTDGVASGERSIIYDVAENRLHVQKAIMALTMGE